MTTVYFVLIYFLTGSIVLAQLNDPEFDTFHLPENKIHQFDDMTDLEGYLAGVNKYFATAARTRLVYLL